MNDKYIKDAERGQAHNEVTLEGEDLLVFKLNGAQDKESIEQLIKDTLIILKNVKFKPNVLVDLNFTGMPTKSGRIALKKWEEGSQESYHAQAMFGLSEPIRLVTNLMYGKILENKRSKIFKTEQEAREWLAQNPPDKNDSLIIPDEAISLS